MENIWVLSATNSVPGASTWLSSGKPNPATPPSNLPSSFAGKLHALLCRGWKQRVKGRDFFDYLWYLSNDIPVNRIHFEARMRQSGHRTDSEPLYRDGILRMLEERFTALDFAQAKADAAPYIKDTRVLDIWNADFFMAVSRERLKVQ